MSLESLINKKSFIRLSTEILIKFECISSSTFFPENCGKNSWLMPAAVAHLLEHSTTDDQMEQGENYWTKDSLNEPKYFVQ
jgi:hypothetical protein